MERPEEEAVADWARGLSSRGAVRTASSVVLKAAIVVGASMERGMVVSRIGRKEEG